MLLLVFFIIILVIKPRFRFKSPSPPVPLSEQENVLKTLTQRRYLEIMRTVNTPRVIPELPLHRRQEIQGDNELIDRADPERREFEILIQLHDINEAEPWVIWGHGGELRAGDLNEHPGTLFDTQGRIRVRDDHQNVHDSYINKSIKESIELIQKNTEQNIDPVNCFEQIRSKIRSKLLERPILFGLFGILKLFEEQKELKISIPDMSEYEALCLVWNRIQSPINNKYREEMIDNLFMELLDGRHQCAGGRFNRIIDSLNMVDPEVKIRPKWAVQREMMYKAGKLRETFLDTQPQNVKDAFESRNSTTEQDLLCDLFNEQYKEHLIQEFTPVYVDAKIMSAEDLSKEINLWVSAL